MSDTGSMWINMLGLGPLFQTINDPAFQLHIRQLVESIGETAERCKRIEMKLDLLLQQAGAEDGPDRAYSGRVAYVPVQLGADGGGRFAAASGSPDNGTGDHPTRVAGSTGGLGADPGPDRTLTR